MIFKTVTNTIKVIIGSVLVVIGIIGGFIPIFQGWIFGIPGLLLLSSVYPPLRKWVEQMKERIKNKKTAN